MEYTTGVVTSCITTYHFSGVCGSGKSFTADRLLLEMFQNTKRTDWLQDIRKVMIIIDGIVFSEDDVMPLPWCSTGRCPLWF